MYQLLSYLFGEWISEVTPFTNQLLEGKTVRLSSKMHLTHQDLQTIQLLLVKNYVHYSPAHLTLRLSTKNVLLYQRLHKIKHFAQTHLSKSFATVSSAFIDNQLLPVPVESADWNQQGKSKDSKKRKQSEEIDYSRLVYESSEGNKGREGAQFVVNIEEVTELMQLKLVEDQLGHRKEHILKSISYKQGEDQLTRLSFAQMYKTIKENKPKAELVRQLISQVKQQRLEDYILQLYRVHDEPKDKDEEPPSDKFSRNILLVFNLIKAFPLISEKQALTKSLLSTQQLRRCLNVLLVEGLLDYYPQRPSPLYRITSMEKIEHQFIERTAQALLNTHHAQKSSHSRQKMVRCECMIRQLDDVLILYGL